MREPLSIGLLSHIASPAAPTGAERSLALLARGLRERGHRVLVVAPGPWSLEGGLREAGVETVTLGCRPCWLAYHDARPLPLVALKWLRYALPDPGRARLRGLLEGRRPDVVHVNCLPHLGGASIASGAGFPAVWHVREILPPGPRRRWWAARLRRFSRRIVAVSEAVAGWVREEGLAARLEVVHNGVAPPAREIEPQAARAGLGLPEDGCLIGLVGQLLPHKGAMEFVRAGRLALRGHSGLRFMLAGPGPRSFLDRLREEIRNGNSADRFHLLPPRPKGEELIAACDVVCLATITPDPFPRTVLEAMAAGRPVAAFRSGGTPEMVVEGETGLLADAVDLEALAATFVRLGADEGLRRSLGAAGALRARARFSIERHVSSMERILREAASS